LENSYLDNVTNIHIEHIQNTGGGDGLNGREVIIKDVQFANPSPASLSAGQSATNIVMDDSEIYDPSFYNYSASDQVMIYGYNADPAENFQVFYSSTYPTNAAYMALIGWVVAFQG
jgi:hypothetical protein